jgi:hypothetical protein
VPARFIENGEVEPALTTAARAARSAGDRVSTSWGGPFTPGETAEGQKSGGTATVLYDDAAVNDTGLLAFAPGSVKGGFVRGRPS